VSGTIDQKTYLKKFRKGFSHLMRLDDSRIEEQVWRLNVGPRGLSEANVLYWRKYLWRCWDFRRPGNCGPPRYDPGHGPL